LSYGCEQDGKGTARRGKVKGEAEKEYKEFEKY
jgi:hypothetical protein